MAEPILTSEQKNELVLMMDSLINNIINLADYSPYFMAFIIKEGNQEIGCKVKFYGCEKCMKFNNITKYDCSKCWFSWWINENKPLLYPAVSNNDILIAFGNDMMEQKKRDNFKCYPLLFKAEKEKSKQIIIDCYNEMKAYLEL